MWVRVDDQVPHHPKFLRAGPIASWLWVCGNCYCSKYLTDGFIEESIVRGLGDIPNARKHAATLVLVGLWERCTGGYRVHDYHHYNPTADEIQQLRVVRAEQGRLGGLAKALAIRQANGKQKAKPELSKNVADPIPSHPIPEKTKIAPPENLSVSDETAERAGQFLSRYLEIYAEERHGAHFHLKPALHYQTACELVQGWPDSHRLELMFRTFCKLPSSEKMAWPGTPAQFLHLAPEIDAHLRAEGA